MAAGDYRVVTDEELIEELSFPVYHRVAMSAFDLNRNLIYAIAAKVYGRGRKGSYELVAADF